MDGDIVLRLPRQGYYQIAKQLQPDRPGGGQGLQPVRLFKDEEIRAGWANPDDVEVFRSTNGPSRECTSPRCIPQEHRLVFAGHTEGMEAWAAFKKGYRYFGGKRPRGARRAGPMVPRPAGRHVDLHPAPGEDAAKTVVVAPRLERLLVLQGDTASRRWVAIP